MATWPLKRMDGLCEITSSKRIFAADYVSEGVPFYRGREITEKYKGNLDISTELFITEDKFREIERKFGAPKQGDLLLTSVGTLGSVYVVKPGDRFYFKDGNLTWFRHFNGLDSQFLYYWIGSPQGKAELKKCTIGSSQSAFTIVLLKSMEIALPPLPAQQRIAAILSAYDELIENSQRRIKTLEAMARAIYREWFVHFRFPGFEHYPRVASPLGEIPQGWEVRTLAELCTRMESGGTPKRSNAEYWEGGEIDWYKTGELWDGFLFGSQEQITACGQRESTARLFEPGTILMAIYGSPTVGRMGILTSHASCNQAALGLVANKALISQTYLYFVLFSLRERFNSLAQGAAQQNISKEKVASALAVMPTRDIVESFDRNAEPIFAQIQTLQRQVQNLRRTRDLLLPRLLSGQTMPVYPEVG
jgi:type I restriction enzyme S subunit